MQIIQVKQATVFTGLAVICARIPHPSPPPTNPQRGDLVSSTIRPRVGKSVTVPPSPPHTPQLGQTVMCYPLAMLRYQNGRGGGTPISKATVRFPWSSDLWGTVSTLERSTRKYGNEKAGSRAILSSRYNIFTFDL